MWLLININNTCKHDGEKSFLYQIWFTIPKMDWRQVVSLYGLFDILFSLISKKTSQFHIIGPLVGETMTLNFPSRRACNVENI